MRAGIEIVDSRISLVGEWTVTGVPDLEDRLSGLKTAELGSIDASGISAMDTAGAWLFFRTFGKLSLEVSGMKPQHASLVAMVSSLGLGGKGKSEGGDFLEKLGAWGWNAIREMRGMVAFVGEAALVLLRGRIRWKPVMHNLQHAGFDALPISGLLSFLMGIVIAYQGAGQLARYGANIFVVDLVGLSMLRELGPLLTAIIIAGRSGSAFTAQIGTMKVTEEVDAMKTIGVSPTEQLVLPKIIALLIALPLLTVYADIMGVLGGMIMASFNLGVGYTDFIDRFGASIRLSAFLVGIGKAPVFASIIAIVGCFQGFQVEGGADSVGRQTTKSVVQAIFLVIVADAIFSVIFSVVHL